MKILAPLYFWPQAHRLTFNVQTPAGRGLRYAGEMKWGQYPSNRYGRNVRYWLRYLHFTYWRPHGSRAKAVGT